MDMANALEKNLEGATVIFKQKYLQRGIVASEQPYHVTGGFGAKPNTKGNAMFGEWLSDGEKDRMEGYCVERLATDEEISAALDKRTGV